VKEQEQREERTDWWRTAQSTPDGCFGDRPRLATLEELAELRCCWNSLSGV
jgi:hypothetical protein